MAFLRFKFILYVIIYIKLLYIFTQRKVIFHFFPATGFPSPQTAHGSPQAGIPQSTPVPIPTGGDGGGRRTLSGWREWRRADPTLINSLWRSRMGNGIRKQLGININKTYILKHRAHSI